MPVDGARRRTSASSVLAAMAAVLAALALANPAGAFSSVPPGTSPHEGITFDAAQGLGFPEDALDALEDAVVAPDAADMELEPDEDEPARIDVEDSYAPEHHCDRVPPARDQETFEATRAYVQEQLGQARDELADKEGREAMDALGRALHAFQDCFSHSNVVDLGADAPGRLGRSLWSNATQGDAGPKGSATPPAGLRFTGFAPETERTEYPEGDAFPHGEHALDAPDMTNASKERLPDGRTKHEAARAAATNATRELLTAFLDGLEPNQKEELFSVKQRLREKLPTPGAGLVLGAIGLLAAATFVASRARS